MVMPNFKFAAGNGITPTASYTPDNAAFTVSNDCNFTQDSSAITFLRPITDGQGFENTNPCARVRFATNSEVIRINLEYTNLVTRMDTYNGVGAVLSNGTQIATFNRGQGAAGAYSFNINPGRSAMRDFDILMPYCASVSFTGIDLITGSTLQQAAAPPSTRYVAIGDSITQGFSVTGCTQIWNSLLSVEKVWQLFNVGYGGRICVGSDGSVLALLGPDVATYLIGYNNFLAQTPLATFKTAYTLFLTNFRASSTAKLYCITPTWTPNTFGPLTIEDYRQQIRDAVSAFGDPQNIIVEGEPLATNSLAFFPDGVHPNDAGAAQIATSLEAIVTL